eukprot:CAMPEP_0184297530 /NCGR_PEP_ID=MMETSP1049-20130417/8424_1 /TAXON_ID=77928 /ORGANISM="Proteomonas sulcata, Strain CCMP704" /LENGTH=207 /DNA_ID=CAMNT_0026607301 /DNA_START=55 /DNA_END=678 /DNA_ORIENTATION=+
MAHVAAVYAGVKNGRRAKNYGKKREKSYEEQTKFWEEIKNQAKINDLMKKYDKTREGNLNKAELAALLQDMNSGEKPTDEEVTWVLKTADKLDNQENGRINRDEILKAVDLWHQYEKIKPEIESLFLKYDTNHSGKLEPPQLKALLTDLNEGVEPEEDEVKMVMSMCDGQVATPTGGINKTELKGAITLWYHHLDKKSSMCAGCSIL